MNKPGRTYNLILFKQSLRYQTRVTTMLASFVWVNTHHLFTYIATSYNRAPAFSYRRL